MPSIVVPSAIVATTNTPFPIVGVALSDQDAAGNLGSMYLEVLCGGSLSGAANSGVQLQQSGKTLAVRGTYQQINAWLVGLTYVGAAGSDAIKFYAFNQWGTPYSASIPVTIQTRAAAAMAVPAPASTTTSTTTASSTTAAPSSTTSAYDPLGAAAAVDAAAQVRDATVDANARTREAAISTLVSSLGAQVATAISQLTANGAADATLTTKVGQNTTDIATVKATIASLTSTTGGATTATTTPGNAAPVTYVFGIGVVVSPSQTADLGALINTALTMALQLGVDVVILPGTYVSYTTADLSKGGCVRSMSHIHHSVYIAQGNPETVFKAFGTEISNNTGAMVQNPRIENIHIHAHGNRTDSSGGVSRLMDFRNVYRGQVNGCRFSGGTTQNFRAHNWWDASITDTDFGEGGYCNPWASPGDANNTPDPLIRALEQQIGMVVGVPIIEFANDSTIDDGNDTVNNITLTRVKVETSSLNAISLLAWGKNGVQIMCGDGVKFETLERAGPQIVLHRQNAFGFANTWLGGNGGGTIPYGQAYLFPGRAVGDAYASAPPGNASLIRAYYCRSFAGTIQGAFIGGTWKAGMEQIGCANMGALGVVQTYDPNYSGKLAAGGQMVVTS